MTRKTKTPLIVFLTQLLLVSFALDTRAQTEVEARLGAGPQPLTVAPQALTSAPAARAEATAVDTDADGFLEDKGIDLVDGTPVPLCPAATDLCLNVVNPDIFVVLVPFAGGRFNSLGDPLAVLRNLIRPGSAFSGVHILDSTQVVPTGINARQISPASSPQKAVLVSEDLGTLGSTTNRVGAWGSSRLSKTTPNVVGGSARIFTAEIARQITAHYAPQPVPPGKIEDCIRHTIAHEVGHNLSLAAQGDPALTGSHYSTTQQVVLSQAPLFIKSGGVTDVICPTTFAAPDLAGFRLK